MNEFVEPPVFAVCWPWLDGICDVLKLRTDGLWQGRDGVYEIDPLMEGELGWNPRRVVA